MDFTTLSGRVMVEAMNCPTSLADQSLRAAVTEFCRRTKRWIKCTDPIMTVAGIHTYTVIPPDGALVHALVRATVDGAAVDLLPSEFLDAADPRWREGEGPSVTRIVAESTRAIRVQPVPTTGGERVELFAAVVPDRTSTEVDDEIGEKYDEAFVYGALYRILNMRTAPWYDPAEAEKKRRYFEREVSDAMTERVRGFATGDARVAMRRVW